MFQSSPGDMTPAIETLKQAKAAATACEFNGQAIGCITLRMSEISLSALMIFRVLTAFWALFTTLRPPGLSPATCRHVTHTQKQFSHGIAFKSAERPACTVTRTLPQNITRSNMRLHLPEEYDQHLLGVKKTPQTDYWRHQADQPSLSASLPIHA